MIRCRARFLALAATAALALAAPGCGNKEDIVTHADTEGIYLDIGDLDYQIQGSRQLNAAIVPDNKYLAGLPDGILPPSATETWFGVFVRVQNQTDKAHEVAKDFEIVDTDRRIYRPLDLDGKANAYSYEPTLLAAHQTLPLPDSSERLGSTQGSLVLFKLPLKAYQNRPLELKIKAPAGETPAEATIDLDL